MHFPVPPLSRLKTSLLAWRAAEFINKMSTRKKWLDLHVTPNGVFATVVEHNFFSRLGTCGKVMGSGGWGVCRARDGSLAKTVCRDVRPTPHFRNVLYPKFCAGKINGKEDLEIILSSKGLVGRESLRDVSKDFAPLSAQKAWDSPVS